jgi:hypothetical protein
MLFDLTGGKRRRTVQAIYLTLAVLMGGGLVLFGIGGDVSGGLFDAFSENQDPGDTSGQFKSQLEDANTALAQNPKDEAALADKLRASYQLALESADPSSGEFTPESQQYLRGADEAWQEYVKLNPEPPDEKTSLEQGDKQPEPSLANFMVQAYSETGLNDPAKATDAAELVAQARPTSASYLLLTRYAALAGQTRTADLAAQKAVELADASDRKAVQQQAEQIMKASAKQAGAAPQPGAAGASDTTTDGGSRAK